MRKAILFVEGVEKVRVLEGKKEKANGSADVPNAGNAAEDLESKEADWSGDDERSIDRLASTISLGSDSGYNSKEDSDEDSVGSKGKSSRGDGQNGSRLGLTPTN